MRNGLLRLRHDVVVGSHNDNGNIRHLSTTSTHGSKGLVTRRVEERNVASVLERHIVSANVLRNTTGLTGNNISLTNVVQQRSLTMVDVTHDGHNRSTWHEILLIVLLLAHSSTDFCTDIFCSKAEFLGNKVDSLGVHALIDADHDADTHASGDNLRHGNIHHRSKLVGSNKLCQLEHLALGCNICHFLLHTLADGLALLTAILRTLTHLAALVRKASQSLANLLGNFFIANFWLNRSLLGVILLLLVLTVAALILLLLLATIVLLLLAVRLIGYSIDIYTLLTNADTLLAVTALAILSGTFTTTLFGRFLLRTRSLVQARQVNLTLDGQTGSSIRGRSEAENFIFGLLLGSKCHNFFFLYNRLFCFLRHSNRSLFLHLRSSNHLLLRSRSRLLHLRLNFLSLLWLSLHGLLGRHNLRFLLFVVSLCFWHFCRSSLGLNLLSLGLFCFSLLGRFCLRSISATITQINTAKNLGAGNLWSLNLNLFHWLSLAGVLALFRMADVLLNELCCFVSQTFVRTEFVLQQRILFFCYLIIRIGLYFVKAFLL